MRDRLPKLKPTNVTTVTAGDLDFEPGSSAVGLVQDGQYTVETLWLGLLLNSGNDAANVLARLGSNGRGVRGHRGRHERRSQAPRRPGHARGDSVRIGRSRPGHQRLRPGAGRPGRFARPDFRRYTASRTAAIPPSRAKPGFQIQNDNQLLLNYPGAIGGKTGFTDIAQHTYVGAAERDGRRLVVTMLNGEHEPVRMWRQGASLLDWGFTVPVGVAVGRLVEPGELEPKSASPAPSPSLARPLAAPVAAQPGLSRAGMAAVGAVVLAGVVTAVALLRRRRAR